MLLTVVSADDAFRYREPVVVGLSSHGSYYDHIPLDRE